MSIDPDMMLKLTQQRDEFETLAALAKRLHNLPAVVEDDYPEHRHYYESALKTFLAACKANGRTL